MGCDGGTIPKRDELVRTRKKPEQKDKDAEAHCKWRLCASTQEPLRSPVVACELGRLFNKESVLEILLDKAKAPECGKHLRNLRDVKELVLTPNPSFRNDISNKGDGAYDDRPAEFICPVLGVEMNGKFKFCFIWTCGCVMSERSLKEIKTTTCHKCQQPFKEEDVIILNPNEEEQSVLTTHMETRRLAAKANGKGKSLKRQAAADNGSQQGAPNKEAKKLKGEPSNGPITGSSSAKIVQKLIKLEDPDMAKVRSDYSVAKDPTASEVYKSLFTTHKKAVNQTKAHWVTFNPFYN